MAGEVMDCLGAETRGTQMPGCAGLTSQTEFAPWPEAEINKLDVEWCQHTLQFAKKP